MIGFDAKTWADSVARSLGRTLAWWVLPPAVVAAVVVAPAATVTGVVGLAVGWLGHRWVHGKELGRVEARFDAYRKADTATDLDVVGPVTGETPVLHVVDDRRLVTGFVPALDGGGDDGLDPEPWVNDGTPPLRGLGDWADTIHRGDAS